MYRTFEYWSPPLNAFLSFLPSVPLDIGVPIPLTALMIPPPPPPLPAEVSSWSNSHIHIEPEFWSNKIKDNNSGHIAVIVVSCQKQIEACVASTVLAPEGAFALPLSGGSAPKGIHFQHFFLLFPSP